MRIAARTWHVAAALCVAALIGALAPLPSVAQDKSPDRSVAITFDDLPLVRSAQTAEDFKVAAKINRKILSALKRHRAPATGFVVEEQLQAFGPKAEQLLAGWNRGRYELANHSFSHADANTLDLAGIEAEIVKGEATIVPMAKEAGRPVRFMRFPFNHLGDTPEKQAGVYALLSARGYTLAAATIDTSDYVFNDAYARAAGERDKAMLKKIEAAFLDHTRRQIAYYADLNQQVLGYEPPAIHLLHVNALNAATLDAQLNLFREAGYRFVSLAEAQSDPAYAEPPETATRFGPMWGYRWARDRGITVDGRLEQEPPEWVSDYAEGKPAG
jgi:peptidoglycan/xylan/chitin deacetylase (PgdA/CDA1 family)